MPTVTDRARIEAKYVANSVAELVYVVNSQRLGRKMHFAAEMIVVAEGPHPMDTDFAVTIAWWSLADNRPPSMKVEFFSQPLGRPWLGELVAALRPNMTPEEVIALLDGKGVENVSKTPSARPEFGWAPEKCFRGANVISGYDGDDVEPEDGESIVDATSDAVVNRRIALPEVPEQISRATRLDGIVPDADEPACAIYAELKKFVEANRRPPKTTASSDAERSLANRVSSYVSRNRSALSAAHLLAFDNLKKARG